MSPGNNAQVPKKIRDRAPNPDMAGVGAWQEKAGLEPLGAGVPGCLGIENESGILEPDRNPLGRAASKGDTEEQLKDSRLSSWVALSPSLQIGVGSRGLQVRRAG